MKHPLNSRDLVILLNINNHAPVSADNGWMFHSLKRVLYIGKIIVLKSITKICYKY